MIGDLILFFKKIYKQQICIHDYKPDRIAIITGLSSKRVCVKCNKTE